MADPLDIFRQRERPGYFVQPTTPPRDIRDLSIAELDSYLRGFSSPPVGNDPTASPYSAQDLRLERARRGTPARRMDEGFEDARISNPPPTTRARPAATPPSNTNAPAQPPAASRQPATDLDRLRAAATDPNFSDQGSLYGPPRPAGQQQQPAQSSVLDMLRKRLARDTENEALQRASEFGAGMLASGSPNFFAMLGGGARAAREGDVSRMDQLRRLAEAERQQRMTDIEEQRRRDEAANRQAQLRLDEQRVAQGNRPQFQFMRGEDGTSVVAVDVLDPTRRIPVPGTLLPGDRTGREELRMRQTARDQAQRAADEEARRRQAIGQTMTADELKNWRDAAERRNLESVGLMPLQGGTAAPASTAPAPSQVLQYGGPRISPQRQQ